MKEEAFRTRKTPLHGGRAIRGYAAIFLATAFLFAVPYLSAGKDKKHKASQSSGPGEPLPTQGLTEDEAILHALNRLAYGARPGDLERIKQMGLKEWVEKQLHPESLDDSALIARLSRFPTLTMSSAKLLDEFPQPQVAARREGISLEEYRKEQQARRQALAAQDQGQDQRNGPAQPGSAEANSAPPADNKMNEPGPRQNTAGNPMFNYQEVRTPQRIVAELSMAKVTRAIYSERQLAEVMADFWFNHFNVSANKGADRWLLTAYERDAIRPHVLGKFRDLLEATAKSPAMLFYLDNWLSADPETWARAQKEQQQRQRERAMRRRPPFGPLGMPRFPQGRPLPPGANAPANRKQKQERGLNENYGRELLELHTLGVDGGYTQADVINVAKTFTGWTIREPRRNPEFFFDARLHSAGPMTVLGHKIHSGGIKDGEKVLDLLARDPHTARHISLELARHFVSDDPPAALVERMAQIFLKTDGDIREVLRTMIDSPEFWSKQAVHSKIKTPFELVVSAARAVGAEVDVPLPLVQWTGRIGQPLYQCEPPTGYADTAGAWVNTGALLNRLNFSLALAANRIRGTQVDLAPLLGDANPADPHAALDRAAQALLGKEMSPQTRETLEQQLSNPQILRARLDDPVKRVNAALITGLILGSPEFQRR